MPRWTVKLYVFRAALDCEIFNRYNVAKTDRDSKDILPGCVRSWKKNVVTGGNGSVITGQPKLIGSERFFACFSRPVGDAGQGFAHVLATAGFGFKRSVENERRFDVCS